MLIQYGNVNSKILKCTEEEYKLFRDILTFMFPNYYFSKAFKKGIWDGQYRFFKGKSFPTGLTFLLQEAMSVTVRKSRNREVFDIRPDVLKTKQLTDKYSYQFDAIQQILAEKAGIWHLATNAGKTVIAAALLQILAKKAIFLVHSKDLLDQVYELFTEEMTLPIGRLGAGIEDIASVTISMPKTVVNRCQSEPVKSWLKQVEVVIVDECHYCSAKTYQTILKNCTGASYRYGLSGTPLERGEIDNLKVMAYLGPVISRISNKELIDLNVSSIPVVTFTEISYFSSKIEKHYEKIKETQITLRLTTNKIKRKKIQNELSKLKKLTYPLTYEECIVNSYVRNSEIAELTRVLIDKGEIVLILVKKIRHGEILERMLCKRGIPVVFRSGESTSEERTESLQDLRDKKSKVLILSKIGEVGLDIPAISSMIRASGGKSTVSTLQAIGRSLRNPTEEIGHIKFYDFWDQNVKFLEEHSQQRWEDYENEGFEICRKGLGEGI